ncbi:MAG TPA: hypothetical protein VIL72_09795, partial [Beijerinckiaceae bacterium]
SGEIHEPPVGEPRLEPCVDLGEGDRLAVGLAGPGLPGSEDENQRAAERARRRRSLFISPPCAKHIALRMAPRSRSSAG